MTKVDVNGVEYIELTREEALKRFGDAWDKHPDMPLSDLYAEVLAGMRAEISLPAPAPEEKPAPPKQGAEIDLLPPRKIGGDALGA